MKTFKQLLEGVIQPNGTDKIKIEALKDTCWKGYTAIGTKKKNGREVPNCVPEEVEVNEEKGNYSVTIHHTHPDGKKEQFNYNVKNANDATHAKRIALQKHGEKKLPTKMYGASSDDVKKLDEGKMAQLHADIEDHLGKHVANYKKMGGAEHLGNKTVEVAKKIAKLHNISHQAAQKHVNDYVDQNLKESDASWAASMEKKKEDRLTDKDKGTLGKIHDLMAKEKAKKAVKEETEQEKAAAELKLKLTKWKNQQRAAKALGEADKKEDLPFTPDAPKKNPVAKAGKFGLGYSIAKHLAKQGMKKVTKEDLELDEAIDKEHPIYKEYQGLMKKSIKDLRDHIKQQHRIVDTSEFRTKEHAASHIINTKHGNKRVKAVFGEETELDEKYDHGPIDREAKVKVGHHAAVVAGSGVDSGKHGKVIGQSKTHIGDQWHIKTADGEVVKMYKNRVAKLKEDTEQIDEISKELAGKYLDKVTKDQIKTQGMQPNMYDKLPANRQKGVDNAFKRLKEENIDEAYRLPSDSEIDKVKAHVKANHPNKSLAQVAVHKQSKKIEYVVKDKEGKMTGHTLGEEVEQIDEISKDTLHSYIHKAFAQGNDLHYDLAHSRGDKATDAERKALQAKISKRNTGIIKAGKKLREDVSMLSFEDFLKEQKACKKEELHPNQKKLDVNKNGKLDSDDFVKLRAGKKKEVDEKYVSDAQRKAVWASKNEKGVKEEADKVYDPITKKMVDRKPIKTKMGGGATRNGVPVAGSASPVKEETEYTIEDFSIEEIEDFMMSEDFEQLDEISKQVLGSYVKKASADIAKREVRIDRAMDASGSNYNEPSMQKALNKNVKRVAGLNKAADKLAKEEVELDEAMTPMQKLKDALDRHSEKAVAANKAGDHEAVKVHQSYMNKIKTKMGKLAKNEEIDLNEMEELCEISKQTLASYIPKAAQSARFSGMHAQHYANKSDRARNKGMQNAYHSLSMKYKNKAWDREANIKKAAQKLAKEENLDELSKKTLQSYQSKIGHDLDRAMDAMPHGTGDDKEDRKLNNRMVGDERAQKRLMKMNKEETEVITFKELLQNISEAKIDDLKDKIAARKATQSAYDKDYKPAAKSNVQKVKGHSYGAGEEEGEDDDDTKKVSKPAAPEVKRGRGRPAGSKSGARR